jgi:hypothetical protein
MLWHGGVARVDVVGRQWTSFFTLFCGGRVLGLCILLFLYSVGVTGVSCGSFVWMGELVWETFLGCLEFSPFVFDVDSLVGT